MNGVVETFRGRSLNELRARRKLQVIIRLLAVSSPVPLVRAGIRIKNNDTVVEVSVCHEQFICLRVHEEAGRSSEVLSIVAAPILSRMTDLQEEFPFRRELQDLVIFLRVSTQPNIIFVVDEDSVLRGKPLEALPRAAPCLKESPSCVEFQHWWRRNAALRLWRIEGGRFFTVGNRCRSM